jgi:hypothetical protein
MFTEDRLMTRIGKVLLAGMAATAVAAGGITAAASHTTSEPVVEPKAVKHGRLHFPSLIL